jgi:hypothetical protein
MKYPTAILFFSIFCALISSTIWAVQNEQGKWTNHQTVIARQPIAINTADPQQKKVCYMVPDTHSAVHTTELI